MLFQNFTAEGTGLLESQQQSYPSLTPAAPAVAAVGPAASRTMSKRDHEAAAKRAGAVSFPPTSFGLDATPPPFPLQLGMRPPFNMPPLPAAPAPGAGGPAAANPTLLAYMQTLQSQNPLWQAAIRQQHPVK